MQQLGLVLTLLLSAPVLAKPLHTPRLQTSVTPAQTQENSYYLPIEFNLHPVDHSSTHVIGYQIKLQATMALHAPDLQQWSRSETILIGADIDDPTMQQRELCPRDLSPTHKDGGGNNGRFDHGGGGNNGSYDRDGGGNNGCVRHADTRNVRLLLAQEAIAGLFEAIRQETPSLRWMRNVTMAGEAQVLYLDILITPIARVLAHDNGFIEGPLSEERTLLLRHQINLSSKSGHDLLLHDQNDDIAAEVVFAPHWAHVKTIAQYMPATIIEQFTQP